MSQTELDPRLLPLDQLRALRGELQSEDDAVSYVRRLVQARLDLVRAEQRRRTEPDNETISDELPAILGTHLTGGSPRPPRPADDFSGNPLALQLEQLCAQHGASEVSELSDAELGAFAESLAEFESQRSHERQELFARIDALSAELVRRYREGEADIDGLLADG